MTTTIKIEFSSIIDNIETYYLDVEFTGNPHSVDVGEDAGEFWGFKYASTIKTILSCEDTIDFDKSKYSEIEKIIIKKYLEDNYDDIDDEICKLSN